MHSLFAKRLFDILLSFFGIIVSLPLWFVISILIYQEDKGPIYYTQERVGRSGRIFKVIKFRSMMPDAEKSTGPVQAEEDDERMTKTGKILRKTAMDELPQLVNILKGDMSFVGPRALRPSEIQTRTGTATDMLHDPVMAVRHSVTPGLTGAAQVFAACDATTEEKLSYDRWYIKKWNFYLDLWLIFVSFLITFKAKWESRSRKLEFLNFAQVNT